MKKHVAIIGGGFGDEGKGQLVDYFAASGNYSTVIRFNGGSQAGHTVVTPSGNRHVFSQLSSGSFMGLPTHLSRFVMVNPIFLKKEIEVFYQFDTPKISIDQNANIITPWDVEVNRNTESNRVIKHGSVGHGINQTVNRSYDPNYRITARDVFDWGKTNNIDAIIRCLDNIELYYSYKLEWKYRHKIREQIQEAFIDAVLLFRDIVELKDTSEIIKEPCIFEGAQGLLLDQNSGFFPFVTPSNTGLTNIMHLVDHDDEVTPVYVTRSFLTRHGAGPMYYDWATKDSLYDDCLHDETNVNNPWQQNMRYGQLSISQLLFAINKDLTLAHQINSNNIAKKELALTWANIETEEIDSANFIDVLSNHGLRYIASGPTRTSISTVCINHTFCTSGTISS